MEDVSCEEDEDYKALKKLTQRIDQLAPTARSKDSETKQKLDYNSCHHQNLMGIERTSADSKRAISSALYQCTVYNDAQTEYIQI